MKIPMFPGVVFIGFPVFGTGFKEILKIAFWLVAKEGLLS